MSTQPAESRNLPSTAECAICAMVRSTPESRLVHVDDCWIAGPLAGLEVPGWIVLALRRHAVEAAPLTGEEASLIGPAIRSISEAIVDATGAERLYLQSYGEAEPHWHLLFSPRGPEVPPEHRRAALFNHREDYIDPTRAGSVLADIRRLTRPAEGT